MTIFTAMKTKHYFYDEEDSEYNQYWEGLKFYDIYSSSFFGVVDMSATAGQLTLEQYESGDWMVINEKVTSF